MRETEERANHALKAGLPWTMVAAAAAGSCEKDFGDLRKAVKRMSNDVSAESNGNLARPPSAMIALVRQCAVLPYRLDNE